ncbi:sodium:solute symporter family protein [Janibacter sp. GS2]|uniref:sodium:solute symporter family protein n=1 Tax=Janibacter sp. GS2 TaxID=3442646 RepID=UPI003EBB5CE4
MIEVIFWVLIALLVSMLVTLGITGAKRSHSLSDHQVPKGLSHVSLALSTASTQASPATFLGVAGFAFVSGLSGLWWIIIVPLVFTGGLILVGKVFRRVGMKFGSLSLPDWVGSRYQSDLLCVLVAVLYLANVFYIVSQLSGVGQILNLTGGLDYSVGLVAVSVLVAIYTLVGGNYAVVKTDAWQASIMVVASGVVIVGSLFVYSNISEITTNLANESPNLTAVFNEDSPVYNGILALAGIALFQGMFATQPHIANRFLMLDSPRRFRPFILISGVTVLILSMSAVTGLAARALIPDQVESPDQAPIVLVNTLFPTVFAAIFAVGVIAAAISTVNSVLSSMGACVGNDIYRRLALKKGDVSPERRARVDRRALLITRATIMVSAIAALALAWEPPRFLAVVATIGLYGFFAGVSGPLVLGIYWRGATTLGAIVTVIVGPIVFFWLHFILEAIPNIFVNGGVGIVLSFVVMFVVSLVTPKLPTAFVDSVVASRRRTVVTANEPVGR